MMLIADSGSTKTSWVLVDTDQNQIHFTTSGFNPYTQTKEQIIAIIQSEVCKNLTDILVEKLYFYGAGCSTDENKMLMHSCFKNYFKEAIIEIDHDLIAAARALWFNEKGIVAILGTGSNSCVYDGKNIIDSVPALGYILGDEGSGAYLGKSLIKDFLYLKMPEVIFEKFSNEYHLDSEIILDKVYKQDNPNKWLASFSTFIYANIEDNYCTDLVTNSIKAFFEGHIKNYEKYIDWPIGVIGSISYYYREIIEKVATGYGFTLKKVIKSPIDELVRYHLSIEKQNK